MPVRQVRRGDRSDDPGEAVAAFAFEEGTLIGVVLVVRGGPLVGVPQLSGEPGQRLTQSRRLLRLLRAEPAHHRGVMTYSSCPDREQRSRLRVERVRRHHTST
ncbi:hypothetical protein Van01_37790 [Micromonospora andamanensis]|uniref:Uncharacterized protein n=1 Tax=Micromonospora andamanensis TaxID=1287068 RepID=A0ABQ4HY55_9ACTN|nr:hypothetical protein Van01_37790 [Micromonospora andamanensis]